MLKGQAPWDLDPREEGVVYGDVGQAAAPRTLVDLPVHGHVRSLGC